MKIVVEIPSNFPAASSPALEQWSSAKRQWRVFVDPERWAAGRTAARHRMLRIWATYISALLVYFVLSVATSARAEKIYFSVRPWHGMDNGPAGDLS